MRLLQKQKIETSTAFEEDTSMDRRQNIAGRNWQITSIWYQRSSELSHSSKFQWSKHPLWNHCQLGSTQFCNVFIWLWYSLKFQWFMYLMYQPWSQCQMEISQMQISENKKTSKTKWKYGIGGMQKETTNRGTELPLPFKSVVFSSQYTAYKEKEQNPAFDGILILGGEVKL